MIMPTASPMEQPVRQCSVALKARRFRESWWAARCASTIESIHHAFN